MIQLTDLNDRQREAVTYDTKPLLVLAGAGSGKTRVITYRIVYLVREKKINPWNILAVTFTNKAAMEMQKRLDTLLNSSASPMTIGTFHSVCNKILRRHIDKLGFSQDFTIFDNADQLSVVKNCIRELDLDEKAFNPHYVLNQIQQIKNKLLSPEEHKNSLYTSDFYLSRIAEVYELYQQNLKANKSLDFDDLLFFTLRIFKKYPDVLGYYQNLWKYISIDEYQDTNHAQYLMIKMLATSHNNICVVGDDDQSIYRWRGADLNNILNFEHQYPNVKTIRLEQNYRSSQNILEAANAVISKNFNRKGKNLWTKNNIGEKIVYYQTETEHDESIFICNTIKALYQQTKTYCHFAIFYRTNAQSRIIEEIFRKNDIPYNLIGSLSFYDRKEIKDIIAYLRIINNLNDSVSIKRIINIPPRGIGKATVNLIENLAAVDNNSSIFLALKKALAENLLPTRAYNTISQFIGLIERFNNAYKESSLSNLVNMLLQELEYINFLKEEYLLNAKSKIENVKELLNAIVEFEQQTGSNNLADFLDKISLSSGIDKYDRADGKVTLMTMHCAKGLEFPVVFIGGMEDGLFPHIGSLDDSEELEEERRLCYVAITRAQKKLYLLSAEQRRILGKYQLNRPSRFIDEIPSYLVEKLSYQGAKDSGINRVYNKINLTLTNINVDTQKKKKCLSDDKHFPVGCLVNHPIWGKGKVTYSEGEGDNKKLVVSFLGEKKKLVLKFARLERL
ncbi:MAG: UvrD-helicase domain-containing protein [bacterium]